MAREFWAMLIVLLGIGTAWLANFDLFGVWGLAVRDHAIAVTLNGFMIGTARTTPTSRMSADRELSSAPPGCPPAPLLLSPAKPAEPASRSAGGLGAVTSCRR
jgi:hypothetical protein